jgi:hypothetical protein
VDAVRRRHRDKLAIPCKIGGGGRDVQVGREVEVIGDDLLSLMFGAQCGKGELEENDGRRIGYNNLFGSGDDEFGNIGTGANGLIPPPLRPGTDQPPTPLLGNNVLYSFDGDAGRRPSELPSR